MGPHPTIGWVGKLILKYQKIIKANLNLMMFIPKIIYQK